MSTPITIKDTILASRMSIRNKYTQIVQGLERVHVLSLYTKYFSPFFLGFLSQLHLLFTSMETSVVISSMLLTSLSVSSSCVSEQDVSYTQCLWCIFFFAIFEEINSEVASLQNPLPLSVVQTSTRIFWHFHRKTDLGQLKFVYPETEKRGRWRFPKPMSNTSVFSVVFFLCVFFYRTRIDVCCPRNGLRW